MSNNDPFIRYLDSLKYENTGTLAALRRACGQRLAESRHCQWFASVSTTPADFLTATLVAQYPSDKIKRGEHACKYQHKGSIAAAWAEYCRKRRKENDPASFYEKRQADLANGRSPANIPSIHERFRTILDAELERDGTGELAHRLRGIVRMLVAENIPIDAIQLAHDLRGWRWGGRSVQERWAKAFYSPALSEKSSREVADEQGEIEESEINDEEEAENAD